MLPSRGSVMRELPDLSAITSPFRGFCYPWALNHPGNCWSSSITLYLTPMPTLNKPKKARLRIYDAGSKSVDRYTVVFMDLPERAPGTFQCLGMSDKPFHPQGFGQHSAAMPGRHLGKRINLADLPPDCQRAVERDLTGE